MLGKVLGGGLIVGGIAEAILESVIGFVFAIIFGFFVVFTFAGMFFSAFWWEIHQPQYAGEGWALFLTGIVVIYAIPFTMLVSALMGLHKYDNTRGMMLIIAFLVTTIGGVVWLGKVNYMPTSSCVRWSYGSCIETPPDSGKTAAAASGTNIQPIEGGTLPTLPPAVTAHVAMSTGNPAEVYETADSTQAGDGTLPNHAPITVTCQAEGQGLGGADLFLQLSTGNWIIASETDAQGSQPLDSNGMIPGIRSCDSSS